jgi:hypothetical protein
MNLSFIAPYCQHQIRLKYPYVYRETWPVCPERSNVTYIQVSLPLAIYSTSHDRLCYLLVPHKAKRTFVSGLYVYCESIIKSLIWSTIRRIIGIYSTIVQTNAHKYIETKFMHTVTPTCFGQPCGRLEGCKKHMLDTLVFYIPEMNLRVP